MQTVTSFTEFSASAGRISFRIVCSLLADMGKKDIRSRVYSYCSHSMHGLPSSVYLKSFSIIIVKTIMTHILLLLPGNLYVLYFALLRCNLYKLLLREIH
jgi:hypothetical protein